MEKIEIRSAESGDLSRLTSLCSELGYLSDSEQIMYRLERIQSSDSDIVYVAVDNTNVVGWIHVFGSLRLESDPFAEIGGLIVSSEHRKKGIGKLLINAAEKWALEKDYSKIRVRSRTKRIDAKRFYEREGYKIIKEQNVFEKTTGMNLFLCQPG